MAHDPAIEQMCDANDILATVSTASAAHFHAAIILPPTSSAPTFRVRK